MEPKAASLITGAAAILLLVLIGSTAALFVQTQKNRQTIIEMGSAYSALEKEKNSLETETALLNQSKNALESDRQRLEEKNSVLEKDLNSTLSTINTFKELINTSMSWFSTNHNFNNRIEEVKETDNAYILAQIQNKCKKEGADYCKIKSGCLPFVNERNGVTYVTDWKTTGKTDYLKDIISTLDDKGGDCEDWSLLFVAEYNYLADECTSAGYPRDKIRINTYVHEQGTNYGLTYNDKSAVEYFRPDSRPADISSGDNYLYVVCGGKHGSQTGHCVVALSPAKIGKSSEVYEKLDGAPLIEPQTGQLTGYINRGSAWHLLKAGQKPAPSEEMIYLVILEDDVIIFNYKYLEDELYQWIGYKDFYERLEEFKNTLT